MAATKRNAMLIEEARKWRFYVYALNYAEEVLYVGKGSGRRLQVQCGRFGVCGHELARFKREKDAYAFERAAIAQWLPRLNICLGGNGSYAQTPRKLRPDKVDREIRTLGTRLYAIKLLRRFASGFDLDWAAISKVEAELQANG